MGRRKAICQFEPYYSRIQELLFNGMTLKDTYDYVKKYFEVTASYSTFYQYVREKKLYWFMPGLVTMGEKKPPKPSREKPKGCKYPDCFHCELKDCYY